MGSWSPTTFGNDEALDFLISLESINAGSAIAVKLREALNNYAAYEEKRKSKTNTFLFTEEWLRNMMTKSGCASGDIERMVTELSNSFGKEQIDLGSREANEAIAASEIVLAKLNGDFSAIHDDGLFLHRMDIPIAADDARTGTEVLDTVLLNKPLAKECGPAWKKNVLRLRDGLSQHAP